MGVRIVVGHADFGKGASVAYLYDSVTGWAFGPQFDGLDEAEDFLDWIERRGGPDPRQLSDPNMEAAHRRWLEERGEL